MPDADVHQEPRMRCGFAHPPPDGTPDREVIDRFRDFLRVAGPPLKPGEKGTPRTPANRYHVRFLIWRMGQVPR